MSACATCAIPGFCCRNIHLFGRAGELRVPEGVDPKDEIKRLTLEPLPMEPRARRETFEPRQIPGWDGPVFGRPESTWDWSCPRLGADGRCTDYENRPHMCRVFEPEEQIECLHYKGAVGWPENLEREVFARQAQTERPVRRS